jgi:hypothetical protein
VPVIAFDLGRPEMVLHELSEAQARLAPEPEVPESIRALVREVADSVEHLDDDQIRGTDPYLVIAMQRAVLAARNALDDEDERRRVRLALEQLRHVFRDIAAGQAVSAERSGKDLARWIADTTGAPQQRLADLAGVSKRTWERWVSPTDTTELSGDDARRLWLIARIIDQLRHALGATGTVTWFLRPRRALDGRAPADLLDDPDATQRLIALAAGVRSSGAT